MTQALSNYRGSVVNAQKVAAEIAHRWPGEEANYDPYRNCMTFKQWSALGYVVKKGEKSIRSLTLVEVKDADGLVRRYPKTVHLFYQKQVEKLTTA
jgi:hypothetical protein